MSASTTRSASSGAVGNAFQRRSRDLGSAGGADLAVGEGVGVVEEEAGDAVEEHPGGHEQACEQVGPAYQLQRGVVANAAREAARDVSSGSTDLAVGSSIVVFIVSGMMNSIAGGAAPHARVDQ